MSVAVHFQQIAKRFGPVEVLHGVDFAIAPGRVLGLLGENGAGKSTLVKILCGYERPTSGVLAIDGAPAAFADSRAAEQRGIVLIHQEFNLAEDLTVAQNIFLGRELRRAGGWLLDDAAMHAEARRVLALVGLEVDPDTPLRRLIVAEKQLVEIAKALARDARLLVMDEPTATLTPGETERLFALIAQLKAGGTTVLYISHKLDEVERITDEIVVLRDGRFVARHATADCTRQQMARLMVGRELADLYPPRAPLAAGAPTVLQVEGATVPGWAEGVSFEVRAGEILGFAGLVGAGRTELFEGLLGLRPRSAGTMRVNGKAVRIRNPRDALAHGIAYLSEDRKGKGLHTQFGLRENLTLMALERYARPLLQRAAERAALDTAIERFGIRARSHAVRAAALSGGNQQKLALAKVLHPDPRVVVLDEPTRGVDIGAKRDIYALVQQLAAEGRAVVVISSELLELIGLCHRIAVLRGGRLATVLDNGDPPLDEHTLIAHATGTH